MGKIKSNIMEQAAMRGFYNNIINSLQQIVAINLYSIQALLGDVVIQHNDREIIRLDYEDYDLDEIMREIKKQLIKNNLFVYEITEDGNTVTLHTTTDIWSLLFVPAIDEEEQSSIELAKIMYEIEKESEPDNDFHSANWEYYESKMLEKNMSL